MDFSSKPGAGIRVLVVDDDPVSAQLAAKALQALGYVALESYDGYDAMAKVYSFAPHAVLLDLEMPGISGFEVARRMRAAGHSRTIHLVALTGSEDPEDRVLARATGFAAFVLKPFKLVNVHGVLSRLTRGEPPATID